MIVFPTTEQVEVFVNQRGDVSIQQDDFMSGDAVTICIPLEHVSALIRAIRQAKKEAEAQ